MKKKIISLLLSLSLITPLLSVPADAYTKGWNVYGQDKGRTLWYYVFDDGSFAQGWQYIDGFWYYLYPQDEGGITLVGNAYITKYGTWTHLWDSAYTIDSQTYYFDTEGRLICNADVCVNEVYYHIDENGHPHPY